MTWNQSSFKGSSSKFIHTLGLCLLTSATLCAASSSSQEAFFLKRITEYWKEGDFAIAKSQILTFLEKYPESTASDSLLTMLGDLYLQEKNYENALERYLKIGNEEAKSKVSFSKAICLFETKRYPQLIEHVSRVLASPIKPNESDTLEFFLAESLLRTGLQETDPSQKNSYLSAALPHFKHLLDTKYAQHALVPLAEISYFLDHKADACHYYGLLLEKRPHDRESLLFKIASLQEELKPKDAIKTYGQIYKLRGGKASEAAYNQLHLLFKEQRFKDLLLYQEEAMRHISEDNLAMVHYWIGKSLFHLEDYAQAKDHLMKTLTLGNLSQPDQKLLLKSLVTCAAKTKNADLLSTLIQNWEGQNPLDKELSDVYLLQYQMLASTNKELAAESLKVVLEKFPSHKDKESILFNLATLQYQQNKWNESEDTLTVLLTSYPQSKFAASAWRYRVNTVIEDLKSSSPETARLKKEELAAVLKDVLSTPKVLSNTEKKEYQLAFCRTLMQLERQEEALAELHDYIQNNPKDSKLAQVHFMTALCYEKSEDDLSLFITHSEKALGLDSELESRALLQLKLFNAYLTLAQNSQKQEKEDLIKKAASHLFDSYQNGSKVKKDNLLWLANLYYEETKKEVILGLQIGNNSNCEKAITLLEDLLEIHHYPPSLELSADRLFQETELLKLAELLGWQGRENEKIDILEVLVYQQKNQPDLPWKLQRKSVFDLARAYEASGNTQEAIKTYDYLVSSSEYSSSYISHLALLERAKLKFISLNKSQIEAETPEWQAVLNDLKDLELKKKLFSEPIHLEAALSYIDFKTAHLPENKKKQKVLQLLQLVKENFSSEQDPKVKEYLAAAAHFPEKAGIYAGYMKLIDSLIYRMRGEIAEENQEIAQASLLFFQASKELEPLSDESHLPSDLLNRIRCNTEAIKKPL